MNNEKSPIKFTYIDNQIQLELLVSSINQTDAIAIDTEFTRSSTYFPILSIIQLAINTKNHEKLFYIIDCYCQLDLSSFFKIISNQKIKKILHSSLQDLQIFFQKNQDRPQAIIDTQILANLCGFKANIGYANLIEEFFGEVIDKKLQNSDWNKRPLTNRQLEYAITDVLYLHEIYQELQIIIEKLNRQQYYSEDIEKFIDRALQDNKESLVKKILSTKKNLINQNLLIKLIIWREDQARILDIPRQHLISDRDLQKIAESKIIDPIIIDKISNKLSTELIEIIKQYCQQDIENKDCIKIKDVIYQDYYELNSSQKQIFFEAKKIINHLANQLKISEQFLLTSSDLKKIINESEHQQDNLEAIMIEGIGHWRTSILINPLAQLLNKKHNF